MPFQIASINFAQLVAALPVGPCWEMDGGTTYASKSFVFGVEETINQDVIFSTDGTNMYVLGKDTLTIYQYTLSPAWDIQSSNYFGRFAIGSEETIPASIAISSDGASVYLIGTTSDTVFQYALSVPYDISTASYGGSPTASLTTGSEEPTPAGLTLSADGSKLYTVGTTNDRVHQYTLPTPWSLNGAVYSGKSVAVTTGSNIGFKPDGTQMQIQSGGAFLQYTLSTAWDVTTAVFDWTEQNIAGLGTSALSGFFYKPDGLSLYVSETTSGYTRITEFPLRLAWDLSTGQNTLDDLSVRTFSSTISDMHFKPDGTKLYFHGNSTETIYQYTMSTPWDITTIDYEPVIFDVEPQDNNGFGIAFSTDGTKMYTTGKENSYVHQYTLDTPWDISTTSYDMVSLGVGIDDSAQCIFVSSDGFTLYLGGIGHPVDRVVELPMTSSWDLSTMSAAGDRAVSRRFKPEGGGAYGMYISPDGTRLFTVYGGDRYVYQHTIQVPWVIATADYDGKRFLVSGQDSTPRGIFFSPDGSKMYMMGGGNEDVFEYDLGTNWDVSTSVYNSVSLDVGPGNNPDTTDLTFGSNGTRLYVTTTQEPNNIIQYNLSVAWDLSTALAAGKVLDTGTEEGNPQGLAFKSDGFKLFVVGNFTAEIHSYTLGTAWEVDTAVYDSVLFSVVQDETPVNITFRDDGLAMYMVGQLEDSIFQYSLSVAWDLSTTLYTNKLKNVVSEGFEPAGVTFKTDGSKMYVCGGTNIYQYTLSPVWDMDTAVYDSVTVDMDLWDISPSDIHIAPTGVMMYVSSGTTVSQFPLTVAWDLSTMDLGLLPFTLQNSGHALDFKTDGTQMYVMDTVFVYQYDLGSPWEASSLSYSGNFTNLGGTGGDKRGLGWSSDGTLMYALSDDEQLIYQYDVGTPWDITTLDFPAPTGYNLGLQDSLPRDTTISSDGLTMLMVGDSGNYIYQYTLSTPFEVSSMSYSGSRYYVGGVITDPSSVYYKSDGTKMYILKRGSAVYQYSLTTPWKISGGATYDSINYGLDASQTNVYGLSFSSDGLRMYVTGSTSDDVFEYDLPTAWVLTGATPTTSKYLNPEDTDPYGNMWASDGSAFFFAGSATDTVYKYTAGTAWQVSTLSASPVQSIYIGSHIGTPYGLDFSPDGTKMYVSGSTPSFADYVYQWDLGTPWDLTTSLAGKSFDVSNEDNLPESIFFKPDGTKMYYLGVQNYGIPNQIGRVYQYTFGTNWDISTLTYDNVYTWVGSDNVSYVNANDVAFSSDGLIMVITGNSWSAQYKLSVAWDISTSVYDAAISENPTNINRRGFRFHPDGSRIFAASDELLQYDLSSTNDTATALSIIDQRDAIRQTGVVDSALVGNSGFTAYVLTTLEGRVQQFTLGTAWDINTVTATGISFNLRIQDPEPISIAFSDDGTKMYMLGWVYAHIHQYTLSVAWDVSSATYDKKQYFIGKIGVGIQDVQPTGIHFSPDGTHLYVIAEWGFVFHYILSIAWDITTAVEQVGDELPISGEASSSGTGVYISPNGTRLFIAEDWGHNIHQYNLSPAWALDTAVYTGIFVYAWPPDFAMKDVHMSDDGLKMYALGDTYDRLVQYTLSTPFELASATLDQVTFNTQLQDSNPEAVSISTDGTKMFMAGWNTQQLYQYSLATPYDVSTGSYDQTVLNVTAQDFEPQDLAFNSDGSKVFMVGSENDTVWQYNMGSPFWELSIASLDASSFVAWTSSTTSATDTTFSADGTNLYITDNGNDDIAQFKLATPWDLSSAGYTSKSFDMYGPPDYIALNPEGTTFSADGTKMFVAGSTRDKVFQFTLPTPWDVSTAVNDNVSLQVGAGSSTTPQGFFFKPDGTMLYVIDNTFLDKLTQYPLATPWDIATAKAPSGDIEVNTVNDTPTSVAFSPDGIKLFTLGASTTDGDKVNEYTLSTAWDITTASQGSPVISFTVAEESVPTGLLFNPTGTKMFIVGTTNDTIYQYTLPSAWSLVGATYDTVSLAVGTEDLTPNGMYFSVDGSQLFMIGTTNDSVYEYTLPTPWTLVGGFYATTQYAVGAAHNNPTDVTFSADGSVMYTTDDVANNVYQTPLSVPYDITSFGPMVAFSTGSSAVGVRFNATGTKMFVAITTDDVRPYDLSPAWDITSAVSGGADFDTGTEDSIMNGVDFSTDGTKMYVPGDNNNKIYQYTLGTGFDLTTASYDGAGSDIVTGAEAYAPTGVTFKPDGTKMYISDDNKNIIIQYSLPTPWSVATVLIEGTVATQDTTPEDVKFSSDGLKMYEVAYSGEWIYEYDLSVAWEVSSAVYGGVRLDTNLPENSPRSCHFSADGTQLYMMGTSTDFVYQYVLSPAWDLSSAIPNGYINSFDVNPPEYSPYGLSFSTDGTWMYIVGSGTYRVYQYPLSVGWDLTTISAYTKELYVYPQTSSSPEGLAFKADGTKMYIVSSSTDQVFEYDLSPAWDVDTAVYNNVSFGTVGPETSPTGTFFKPDGLKLYVAGADSDTVFTYTLSSAWDIGTATNDGISFNVSGLETSISGVTFKPDGTQMFITGKSSDQVIAYDLSVAWDITTANFSGDSYSTTLQDTTPTDVFFSPDGLIMYMLGDAFNSVFQYTLSVAWDISTASYAAKQFVLTLQNSTVSGVTLSTNGAQLYISGNGTGSGGLDSGASVYQYTLGSPNSLELVSYDGFFSIAGEDTVPEGVRFKTDGTKMYVVGSTGDSVYQYTLSTPWEISSASYDSVSLNVSAQNTAPQGIDFSSDGTIMHMASGTGMHQYTLSIGWDLSTALYANETTALNDFQLHSISFSPDGKKMVLLSALNDSVFQYTLSVGFDVSTATYDTRFNLNISDDTPQGCRVCDGGSRLFVAGSGSPKQVYQYTLSTPWDVSSATIDALSLDISTEDTDPQGIEFNDDGTIMYITGDANNRVYQYTL